MRGKKQNSFKLLRNSLTAIPCVSSSEIVRGTTLGWLLNVQQQGVENRKDLVYSEVTFCWNIFLFSVSSRISYLQPPRFQLENIFKKQCFHAFFKLEFVEN